MNFLIYTIIVRRHVHTLCTIKHPDKTWWESWVCAAKKGICSIEPFTFINICKLHMTFSNFFMDYLFGQCSRYFQIFHLQCLWCSPSCKYECLIFYINGLRYTLTISIVQWDRLQSNGVAKLWWFLAPASSQDDIICCFPRKRDSWIPISWYFVFSFFFYSFLGWKCTWIFSFIPLWIISAFWVHFVMTVNSLSCSEQWTYKYFRPLHFYVPSFCLCSKTVQSFIRRCVLQYLAYTGSVMKNVTCKRRRSSITINCSATMEWTQFKLSELILSGSLSTYNCVATHCRDANATKGA